ncbi:MAG: patatin-like phospholipase family protein [Polyangiaceae bacterium]|jgi:predicted acylesterase/phospholipase RssA|nr:patatin-like phospholipase family protein [Polyangiaceae bacterium]
MEHVVYFVAGTSQVATRAIESALEAAARHASPLIARGIRFRVETEMSKLLGTLPSGNVDALVIDSRGETGDLPDGASYRLLQTLFHERDSGGPIGREQTWLVVSSDERGTRLAFEAGRTRLAGAVPAVEGEPGWREIWRRVEGALRRGHGGGIALCLAGGGIDGLFYQFGVLRALQHFMPEFALHDVDIICGISAGAVLGAFMANGLSSEQVVRGMQFGEGPIDKIDRFSILDPNFREVLQRIGLSSKAIATGRTGLLQSLFRVAPTGVFAGNGLRRYLACQLAKPGMSDSFTNLKHRLFIGATDQDTAEHVVFGSPGWDHIPIHRAVRASSALTPLYAPERIEDRYYVDGAFTRTTNVRVAVENGATLVLLVDPWVPVFSEHAGYVAGKGGLAVGMQGLKSLIHGRFDRALSMMRTMYPHVAFHLFQPDGATMRVMAGSPMKFFYRAEIEEIAYRETLRSIRQQRFESLQRDFARHAVPFVDPEADMGSIKRELLEEASEVQVA